MKIMKHFTIMAIMLCGLFLPLPVKVIQADAKETRAVISGDQFTSPRLVALQKEVGSGNRASLEEFWQQIAKQGTPLIEPVTGESSPIE
jgi:hypothetical protein